MAFKNHTKTVKQSKLDEKVKEVTEEIKKKEAADDIACQKELNAVLEKYKRALDPQIMISGTGKISARLVLLKTR